MKIICSICIDTMNPFDTDDPVIESRINQHNGKHNRINGTSQRDGHVTNNSTVQGTPEWITIG